MKKIVWLLCGTLLSASAQEYGEPSNLGSSEKPKLTLDQALVLAREYSPELKAAHLQAQAAGEAVYAVGRWKNPVLDLKSEKIGGDYEGTESANYSAMLRQTFERGGKRRHARLVAEESVGIAFHEQAGKELALLAEVHQAFIEVLAQQETETVRAEQEQLGRTFVEVAKRRFEAGRSSELDLVEAELALEEIKLFQTKCFGDLEAARIRLASLIGIPEPEMDELTGDYYILPVVEDAVVADTHPALRRLNAAIAAERARAAWAKSTDAADITLGAGYKHDAGDETGSFMFGVSMPLVFVRSGKAAQTAALTRVDALTTQYKELRRKLQEELSVLAAVYQRAKREAEMTRDRLIPRAEKAYELSKAGYDAGRFSWLELISTQQYLTEIRVRRIEALKSAHQVRAEITRFLQEGIN